jgi:uncharacterized membrane protein
MTRCCPKGAVVETFSGLTHLLSWSKVTADDDWEMGGALNGGRGSKPVALMSGSDRTEKISSASSTPPHGDKTPVVLEVVVVPEYQQF